MDLLQKQWPCSIVAEPLSPSGILWEEIQKWFWETIYNIFYWIFDFILLNITMMTWFYNGRGVPTGVLSRIEATSEIAQSLAKLLSLALPAQSVRLWSSLLDLPSLVLVLSVWTITTNFLLVNLSPSFAQHTHRPLVAVANAVVSGSHAHHFLNHFFYWVTHFFSQHRQPFKPK